MKIIEFIPQISCGGAERFTVDLCNRLAKDNEVVLCIYKPLEKYGFYKDEVNSNVRIVYLNKKEGFDFTLLFRFYKFIKSEKPDIVHSHLIALVYMTIAVLFYKKARYFHTIHSKAKQETCGRLGEIARKFFFRNKLVTPVTISPDTLDSFKELYGIGAPLISNGRDIPSDLQVSLEVMNEFKEFRRGPKTRVITQVAHIGKTKRQDLMARVADRLMKEGYDFTVLIIGRSADEAMVDRIKSLKNPYIYLLGSKHNPLEYLKMSDAFVMTSAYEGMPISLIEAMGVGAVPVCTPAGGIVNLVNDGVNGFLSKDLSEEAYYEALKRYLETSEEQLNAIKKETLKSYAPYSMQECGKKYIKLFQGV